MKHTIGAALVLPASAALAADADSDWKMAEALGSWLAFAPAGQEAIDLLRIALDRRI